MSNAVFFFSFKLKKDTSVSDFLLAAEKLNNEFISKQKGYISWKQLVDGEWILSLLKRWMTFATSRRSQLIQMK